jgi:hypothetical protein
MGVRISLGASSAAKKKRHQALCGIGQVPYAQQSRSLCIAANSACQLAALLRYLGCTGRAHEAASLNAGDDQRFLQLFADADVGRTLDSLHGLPSLPGARHSADGKALPLASRTSVWQTRSRWALRGRLLPRRTHRRRRHGHRGSRAMAKLEAEAKAEPDKATEAKAKLQERARHEAETGKRVAGRSSNTWAGLL